MIERKLNWTDFKNTANTFGLNIKYFEFSNFYELYFADKNVPVICRVKKTSPASSDQTDFENNYKASANGPLYHLVATDTFTVAENGATVTAKNGPKKYFSIQVSQSGIITAWSVELQVSMDNSIFDTIGKHTELIGSGKLLTVSSESPALYFRAKCSILTLGLGTSVTSKILAME